MLMFSVVKTIKLIQWNWEEGTKMEYKWKQMPCVSNEYQTQWKGKKRVTFELNSLIAYYQSRKKKKCNQILKLSLVGLFSHSGINVIITKTMLCSIILNKWHCSTVWEARFSLESRMQMGEDKKTLWFLIKLLMIFFSKD